MLTDKVLLLPIVKKTLFLYDIFGIKPNTITLFNTFVVSSSIFYFTSNNNIVLSYVLCFLRCVLDGSDGYIAR